MRPHPFEVERHGDGVSVVGFSVDKLGAFVVAESYNGEHYDPEHPGDGTVGNNCQLVCGGYGEAFPTCPCSHEDCVDAVHGGYELVFVRASAKCVMRERGWSDTPFPRISAELRRPYSVYTRLYTGFKFRMWRK